MSENILLLVLAGVLVLTVVVHTFSDGIKYGFGQDGSLMSPAQVSAMWKVLLGGLCFVILLVFGAIWLNAKINSNSEEIEWLRHDVNELMFSHNELVESFEDFVINYDYTRRIDKDCISGLVDLINTSVTGEGESIERHSHDTFGTRRGRDFFPPSCK